MQSQIKITKVFSLSKPDLYSYFTEKSLLERWCAPDGMSLKLPIFEAKVGGKYRYEHTAKNGTYVAVGYFKEYGPGRIVQIDQMVMDPSGKKANANLECQINFSPKGTETEVKILHGGFENPTEAEDCRRGWEQCLASLEALLGAPDRSKSQSAKDGKDSLIGIMVAE